MLSASVSLFGRKSCLAKNKAGKTVLRQRKFSELKIEILNAFDITFVLIKWGMDLHTIMQYLCILFLLNAQNMHGENLWAINDFMVSM